MTHGDANLTFERHRPLWDAHGCDILVYSPVDSPCISNAHDMNLVHGSRGHHSAEANRRFKRLISFLATTAYDRHVIFEYDAICLTPTLPIFYEWSDQHTPPKKNYSRPYVCGNVFYDDNPDSGFEGGMFIHPPLMFTAYGIQDIAVQLKLLPDDVEKGFWDRMLGLACENAGIKPMNFMAYGLGYAENTINENNAAAALQAAANGALFFHGVKSPHVLASIKHGHELAKANGKLRHGLEIPL